MEKIRTRKLRDGATAYYLFPFDAYYSRVKNPKQKAYYYIQVARGTTNMNQDLGKRRTFKTRAEAVSVIRKWLMARKMKYEGEKMLKQLKGGRR